MKQIVDNLGNQWIVEKDDPGRHIINKLRGLGFHYIVLPYELLLGVKVEGQVVIYPVPNGLSNLDTERVQRMNDCIYALQGGKVEVYN